MADEPKGSSRRAGAGATGAEDAATLEARATAAEARAAELETAAAKRDADAAAAKKAADEAEALKRGESDKLYLAEKASREAAEARASELAATLAERDKAEAKRLGEINEANKARVAKLPEEARELVTDTGLKGRELRNYLDKHWERLSGGDTRPAGTQRAKAGPADGDTTIPEAIRNEAAAKKLDAKLLLANVKKFPNSYPHLRAHVGV